MISIDLINVAERLWLDSFKKLKMHLCHSNNMRFNAFMVFSMKMELHQVDKLYLNQTIQLKMQPQMRLQFQMPQMRQHL